MSGEPRKRFWVEALSTIVSFGTLVLTLAAPTWIETVSGFDPDHHSGSIEWIVVAVLFVISFTSAVLARAEWRRGWALSSR
jgi:hypothetical protein